MKSRWLASATIALCSLLFLLVAPRLSFTTSITRFLPTDGDSAGRRSEAIASALANGDTAQTLVVDLTADSAALARVASRFHTFLREHPRVRTVTSAGTESEREQIAAFIVKQAPWTFLAPHDFDEKALRARLLALKDHLAAPDSALYSRAAPRDPLGGTWEAVHALEKLADPSTVAREGILYSADERHAFFFVTTKASAFDAPEQRRFLADLQQWKAAQTEAPSLAFAGAAPFAVASEAQIQHDIQHIGIWSTVGILLLFALLFRSLRLIVLALVPMAAGCVGGLVACHFAFGSVHGITLAFGTSLLGVGIDYAEHYYAHFALLPEDGPFRAMKSVWRSIALGGFTTILGLSGLLFSGSHGLEEMAVFSAASVMTAFFATVFLVPPFMPRSYRKPPLLAALYSRATVVVRSMIRLGRTGWVRFVLVASLASFVALGALRTRFTDEVDLLLDPRGAHVVEDKLVRARLQSQTSDAVAVLIAEEATFAERLSELTAELEQARERGLLRAFPKVDSLLPSQRRQDESRARAIASEPAIRGVLAELDFEPSAFEPYFRALGTESSSLTVADLMASPLRQLVRIEQKQLPGGAKGYMLVLPLGGVENVNALQAGVKSAFVVEPRRELVTVFRNVRAQMTWASALGLIAIFLVLGLRYRSARLALAASLPAAVAAGLTMAIFAVAHVPLNILHLVALLLVLGMGVDYGVFLVDKTQSTTEAARSLVSILTASLTTILSFGLLAFSENPGLSALGRTVALGVLGSLVLSPLAIAAFRVELKDDSEDAT